MQLSDFFPQNRAEVTGINPVLLRNRLAALLLEVLNNGQTPKGIFQTSLGHIEVCFKNTQEIVQNPDALKPGNKMWLMKSKDGEWMLQIKNYSSASDSAGQKKKPFTINLEIKSIEFKPGIIQNIQNENHAGQTTQKGQGISFPSAQSMFNPSQETQTVLNKNFGIISPKTDSHRILLAEYVQIAEKIFASLKSEKFFPKLVSEFATMLWNVSWPVKQTQAGSDTSIQKLLQTFSIFQSDPQLPKVQHQIWAEFATNPIKLEQLLQQLVPSGEETTMLTPLTRLRWQPQENFLQNLFSHIQIDHSEARNSTQRETFPFEFSLQDWVTGTLGNSDSQEPGLEKQLVRFSFQPLLSELTSAFDDGSSKTFQVWHQGQWHRLEIPMDDKNGKKPGKKSGWLKKGGFNINTTMPNLGRVATGFHWTNKTGHLKLRNQNHDLSAFFPDESEELKSGVKFLELQEITVDYKPFLSKEFQLDWKTHKNSDSGLDLKA